MYVLTDNLEHHLYCCTDTAGNFFWAEIKQWLNLFVSNFELPDLHILFGMVNIDQKYTKNTGTLSVMS